MVKKPEPVAYLRKDELKRLGVPATTGMSAHHVSESALLRATATKELADQYGHSVQVITVEQAEAYAAERVREALEQAAKICEYTPNPKATISQPAYAFFHADQIRALITKE